MTATRNAMSSIGGIAAADLCGQQLAYEVAVKKIFELPTIADLEDYISVVEDELEKLNQMRYFRHA